MKKALLIGKGTRTWINIEYFDPSWTKRIKEMSKYIQPGKSIIDLGCGKMWLKQYLKDNKYFPVDYTDRGEGTIICDFNTGEFPEINADVAFISGALEYVEDPDWFISNVSKRCSECVISYCTIEDYPDVKFRNKQGWVNSYSNQEIIDLFAKFGFKLVAENTNIPKNRIFYFTN